MHSNYTVVLDACVLAPAQLRDCLITLSETGLFRPRWTDQIHEEWIKAVLEFRPDIDRARLERTRANMNDAVLDCLVTGYEALVDVLTLPDPNDRHVLAAAIRAGADAIVTTNLRDFPIEVLSQFGIDPIVPDDFVVHQLDFDPERVVAALSGQRRRLRRPPKSPEEFVATLRLVLPNTAARLDEMISLL